MPRGFNDQNKRYKSDEWNGSNASFHRHQQHDTNGPRGPPVNPEKGKVGCDIHVADANGDTTMRIILPAGHTFTVQPHAPPGDPAPCNVQTATAVRCSLCHKKIDERYVARTRAARGTCPSACFNCKALKTKLWNAGGTFQQRMRVVQKNAWMRDAQGGVADGACVAALLHLVEELRQHNAAETPAQADSGAGTTADIGAGAVKAHSAEEELTLSATARVTSCGEEKAAAWAGVEKAE